MEKGFFARFTGLFRTPSTWTLSARLAATFFEHSMANNCWSSRAPVLLLRLLSWYRQRHLLNISSAPHPPQPPHRARTLKAPLSLRVPVPLFALAADIMCDVGRVGAAKRHRDRQLRAFPPTRTVDGANGAGDGPPPQRSTLEVKSGGRAE